MAESETVLNMTTDNTNQSKPGLIVQISSDKMAESETVLNLTTNNKNQSKPGLF